MENDRGDTESKLDNKDEGVVVAGGIVGGWGGEGVTEGTEEVEEEVGSRVT
jgi:hypothetical protein